jgi:hypothetical protein
VAVFAWRLGLARTIFIRCIYGIQGREITKYTVIYGAYITVLANPTDDLTAYLFKLLFCKPLVCRPPLCSLPFVLNLPSRCNPTYSESEINLSNLCYHPGHGGMCLLWHQWRWGHLRPGATKNSNTRGHTYKHARMHANTHVSVDEDMNVQMQL